MKIKKQDNSKVMTLSCAITKDELMENTFACKQV